MARVALNLPHDVLPDLVLEETDHNFDMGVDYMRMVSSALIHYPVVYRI
jgi:hypothetical protein